MTGARQLLAVAVTVLMSLASAAAQRVPAPASSDVAPLPASATGAEPVPFLLRRGYDDERDDATLDDASVPAALADWNVARLERRGSRVAAVTTGRANRTGIRSLPQSCQLHVSDDGGEHFGAALDLGFTQYEPWVVRARSRVPLLRGDAVTIEALRCPDDELRMPGPRIRGAPARWPCDADPVAAVLRFSLAALARDADGDGLSDSREAWLYLDPKRADTDGDGVPDAKDPCPRVPKSASAPALASLLEWLAADDVAVTQSASVASPVLQPQAQREQLVLLQVATVPFLQRVAMSEPRAPKPPAEGMRLIAMTSSEARAHGLEETGYGLARMTVTFDPAGARAWLDVDRGGEGASYLAERTPTGWTLRDLGGWVE